MFAQERLRAAHWVLIAMKNYLQYKAVIYWTNLLKKRESYCINPAFFATAHVFLTHESLVVKLRAEIPADSLRWLQETAQPPYRNRLEIDGKLEDVLCVIWNAPTLRPTLRDILVVAAEGWLAEAEDEGIEPSSSPGMDAAHDVERCVAEGLLVPPGSCATPEEIAAFVKMAALPVKPESTGALGVCDEEQVEL